MKKVLCGIGMVVLLLYGESVYANVRYPSSSNEVSDVQTNSMQHRIEYQNYECSNGNCPCSNGGSNQTNCHYRGNHQMNCGNHHNNRNGGHHDEYHH